MSRDHLSCRILRHLRAKDPAQLRLQHLEQGFSVYVNGANSEPRTSPRKAAHAEGPLGEHSPGPGSRAVH